MVDLRLLDEASTAPLARSPACLEPELLGVLNKMLFVCGSEASSEVWSRLGPHTFCSRAMSQNKKNLYCGTCDMYEYKQGGKADGDLVQRTFVLQEVLLDDGHVVIKAIEQVQGAQPWEFTFRNEPKLGSGVYHWVLSNNSNGSPIDQHQGTHDREVLDIEIRRVACARGQCRAVGGPSTSPVVQLQLTYFFCGGNQTQ